MRAVGGKNLWLVAPGYQMARVAAAVLAGEEKRFTGADMSTKLKLLGVDVASFGDAHGRTPGALSYQWMHGPQQIYKNCGQPRQPCWVACWWAMPANTPRWCR